MSIRINYNPMSVLTHRNLVSSDRLMGGVLDRMSSGERLRRSADDPASMVVANAVRYHRTGVDRAQSNAEEVVTMLQTAEGSMDEITQVLQRIRTLAVAALSAATQDPNQLQALQDEMDAGIGSITTIAKSTTFGGLQLLDGSLHDNTLSDDAKEFYQSLAFDYTKLPGGTQDGATISIDPMSVPLSRPAMVDAYGAGTPASTPAFLGSGPVTITGPKGSTTLNLPAGMPISSLVSAINASSAITGVIAAYDEATGDLTTESTAYGASTLNIDLSASSVAGWGGSGVSSPPLASIVLNYTDKQGNPQTAILEQDPTSPDGRTFSNTFGGPEGAPPYTGFAPGAISLVVQDTSAGGVGSVIDPAALVQTATRSGTTAAQIGALASQRVTVDLMDMRAGALGSSAGLAATGFASLADLVTVPGPPAVPGALVAGNAGQALELIDAALNEVNRARGAAGALQGNTVERVMDTLRTSSVNLREYEGILRDVDMAAESAEYARVQIMIQAATAMLAQANQVPQTVLQLLK